MGGDSARSTVLTRMLMSRSSIYSYLSVTPNGDVHLDRPKDDKIIDELFNDLMVKPPHASTEIRINETSRTYPLL